MGESHEKHPEDTARVLSTDGIDCRHIDEDARRVISRLQRHGFEAYLVGGCVRDILLGRPPKDFDLATSARPRQVRRLFRNARLIGRRFRLVHIIYGDHIVETATFRRDPGLEAGTLIKEDNTYGTAEEDARRRDFTVNGLFLDPERGVILDWVGGLEDIEARILRTIGPPAERIAEDPVRSLRAIRFATRLDFRVDPDTWNAMRSRAGDLEASAPPRVIEEVLRMLRSGTGQGSLKLMLESMTLAPVLSDVHAFLTSGDDAEVAAKQDRYWRLLEALDAEIHAGLKPSDGLCLAVLYLPLIEDQHGLTGTSHKEIQALHRAADRVLEGATRDARLPKRHAAAAVKSALKQPHFDAPPEAAERLLLFLVSPGFDEGMQLFRIRCAASGRGWDQVEAWEERNRIAMEADDEDIAAARRKARRRPRRKPRKRRRSAD